jgi:dolichol-phosphate mannosyltransferase
MLIYSVIIPLYNDDQVIKPLCKRLIPIMSQLAENYEILFIDDGSKDQTWHTVLELKETIPQITAVKLARNFGQQNAISAGLDIAIGDIVVIMDSDLQDKPEDIPLLLSAMEREGKDMAIAKWMTRKESFKKKFFSKLFHNFSARTTKLKYEPGLGVFRVLRRSAVEQLLKVQENTGTIISLIYWAGIDYTIVELNRDPRFAGSSGYNLQKMLKLTADRIFSYSLFPIRMASILGMIVGFLSMGFGFYLIIRKLLFADVAPGWTSTLVILSFLFGLNFFFLGIIGEYLGRIYIESKNRPKYVISKKLNSKTRNHGE